jgi:hypothetical protein
MKDDGSARSNEITHRHTRRWETRKRRKKKIEDGEADEAEQKEENEDIEKKNRWSPGSLPLRLDGFSSAPLICKGWGKGHDTVSFSCFDLHT